MWASQFWTYTEPRTWISSHGLGTMGYGVPAAVGARVAADTMGEQDREVVCFDGDGSFLMTMQELSVAVREDLDITIAVLNNEYIGMVRQWQDAFYEGRHMASDYTWMPEFDKLAEAFGALGLPRRRLRRGRARGRGGARLRRTGRDRLPRRGGERPADGAERRCER